MWQICGNYIDKYNPKNFQKPLIIAKIEKPEAVKNFDAVLTETDAVMVARGDLGVEMPENQVPIIQKTIIQKCLKASKPVIVATQMLDSMIRNPRPTRAEVSDVANAVIDQADCVMLSGETAFGKYPVKAVAEMARIIETTEKCVFLPQHKHLADKIVNKIEAMSESCLIWPCTPMPKLIVGATESRLYRPRSGPRAAIPSVSGNVTPRPKTLRQINMIWGVHGIYGYTGGNL